jgi:hypothetical protein
MERHATDEVLAHLDALLAEGTPVTCWRCEKAVGAPSLCVTCKSEIGYQAPPKGTVRTPWLG